jgi:septal ring factor EnvC (AmiA/AmiB activator)
MNPETIQSIVVAVISGGLVSGIFTLVGKKTKSPESQNDLAKLGNEFAAQLLEDARAERKELRLSIQELENSNDVKQATINRLNDLLAQKDRRITELEERQNDMARKLQRGEAISLRDIFGHDAPNINMTLLEETP